MKKQKIAIVGAGLAGLTAAYELSKDSRYEISVYEKESSPGGRTRSVDVLDTPVDVGGFIVYPWYTHLLRIAKELNVLRALRPLQDVHILYKLPTTGLIPQKDIPLSLSTRAKLGFKLLPKIIDNHTVGRPSLQTFRNMSVEEFLHTCGVQHDKTFVTYIDTILQGYCYAPLHEYQAAFMFPMMASNLFFGDIHTASYFPKGIRTLVDALEKTLKKRGVQFFFDTTVEQVQPRRIVTKNHTILTDDIVLAHPVDMHVPFTHFLTVVADCHEQIQLQEDPSWGAVFLAPQDTELYVTSFINTTRLYGKKMKNIYTFNIKLKNADTPYTKKDIKDAINAALIDAQHSHRRITLLHITHWQHTMPISNERTVALALHNQGKRGIWYAGDFLGCPSMETAVTTGINVAQLIKEKRGQGDMPQPPHEND